MAPHHAHAFAEAFAKAVGVIGASEIGDKTFFIAAIMAMRHARLTVRCGGGGGWHGAQGRSRRCATRGSR